MIDDKRMIFQGYVINNQDPLMLGRVRALPVDQVEADILPINWNPEKDIWTERDPLIFLPLLPYYISQIPKIDEYIHIFYYNTEMVVDNSKFYIQGPITRPQNNFFESWHNSESMLASGVFLKQANNIKDPLSFEIKAEAKGIYPEPGDNALLGRGTSDVIVKQEEVLIRAGKNIPTQTAGFNLPTPRLNRAFVQLSNFELERGERPPKKVTELIKKPLVVKKLIEWEITNQNSITGLTQNNSVTGVTYYDGNIKLYSLLPKAKVTTIDIHMNTPLDNFKAGPEYELFFTGQTLEEGVKIINQFISGVNNGKINVQNYEQYPFDNSLQISRQFPFYFRPSKNNVDKLSSTGSTDFNMVNNFFTQIKLLPSNKEYGSVLVWTKNIVGQQLTVQTNTLDQNVYTSNPVSYGTMAADTLYLLSHKTDIPSKRKIVLEPKETLYGIPQPFFTEIIGKNTDPMVRGNELMKLLTLIVNFLESHVHNINEAPIPVAVDGTKIEEIRNILQNSDNTILNQRIRLN